MRSARRLRERFCAFMASAIWHASACLMASASNSSGLPSGLSLGNAGKAKAFAIIVTVLRPLEGVVLSELLDGEIGLERQQFLCVRRRLVAPTEMAERSDQRLVAVDKVGIGGDHSP